MKRRAKQVETHQKAQKEIKEKTNPKYLESSQNRDTSRRVRMFGPMGEHMRAMRTSIEVIDRSVLRLVIKKSNFE